METLQNPAGISSGRSCLPTTAISFCQKLSKASPALALVTCSPAHLFTSSSVLPVFEAVSKSSSGLEAPPTKNYELFMVSRVSRQGHELMCHNGLTQKFLQESAENLLDSGPKTSPE
jgi:hypothetical protein